MLKPLHLNIHKCPKCFMSCQTCSEHARWWPHMCRSIKGIVLMVCCMTLHEMLFAFQVLGNLMTENLLSLVPFNVYIRLYNWDQRVKKYTRKILNVSTTCYQDTVNYLINGMSVDASKPMKGASRLNWPQRQICETNKGPRSAPRCIRKFTVYFCLQL